ncbi:MAG: cupin domain-containing protein [Archangiaceae bacterium]|nr:cupin domain-containing protein [Archangiaceae bacterium]
MKIVKSKDVAWADALQKGNFGQRRKELGSTGKLSTGLWELAPGKKSFPFHLHHVTEEQMFVLSGTGKVRSKDGLTAIGPGDWVGFPPGGSAHQLINDGTEPLVYVAMGANIAGVDVVEYPDSNKVASSVVSGEQRKRYLFKADTQVDYLEGEKDAQ